MSALVLKLLAAAAMLADHLAVSLYPFLLGEGAFRALRLVGRVAFPIFAYFIPVGYGKSSSVPRYLTRLCAVALLSQVPFSLVFVGGVYRADAPCALSPGVPWPLAALGIAFVAGVWLSTVRRDASVALPALALLAGVLRFTWRGVTLLSNELNVFYTLALGLCCVSVLDRAFSKERKLPALLLQAAAVAACFALIRDTADYRTLGAALIVCFWAARDQKLSQLLLLVMWAAIEYLLGGSGLPSFLAASCSAVLLYFYNGQRGQGFRRFFYWFYPAHLALLGAVHVLLSS